MNRLFPIAAVVLMIFAVSTARAESPHRDQCVILISVDGLANFYLDDPHADLPTIRQLAREGTRAKGIVCSLPTVTWPNHTTLVTGVSPAKHGVIGNSYLDRKSQTVMSLLPDPLFDKDEIVKVPTIYDVAYRSGLITSGILWPATRNARTLHFTVPDMAGDTAWPQYGTKTWLDELREAGVPVDSHGKWVKESKGAQRDWLYTQMAAHVLKQHSPNLLVIHLVEVDHAEHGYGPRSPEAYWAVGIADDRVRDIVDAVKESPFKDKTTIIVAADHGFFPVDHDIRPNVLLRSKGLIGGDSQKALCVSQGGACMVYVLDETERTSIVEQLVGTFKGVDGVDAVFTSAEFAKLGQPLPQDDPHAPDLWLTAKEGYSFSDSRDGENVVVKLPNRIGTHGYLPDQPDMLASLVMSGYGIKPGVTLDKTSSTNVAPTIAKLLGLKFPDVEGKALSDALVEP